MGALEAKAQERIIEEVTYKMEPLPNGIALEALSRLMKMLGQALMGGIDAAAVTAAFFSSVSAADLIWLRDAFAKASHYQAGTVFVPLSGSGAADRWFSEAGLNAQAQWFVFALEVNNFAGFFDGLKKGASGLLQAMKPKGQA